MEKIVVSELQDTVEKLILLLSDANELERLGILNQITYEYCTECGSSSEHWHHFRGCTCMMDD